MLKAKMAALDVFLSNVKQESSNGIDKAMISHLNSYIRKHKYWPMLQTKKISDDLILLHNTYIRDDVFHFKDLYDTARSVVLSANDLSVIVSFADPTPIRLTIEEYAAKRSDTDIYSRAFEGTMIYVYNYNNKWYFGTSTCPSIDESRYSNPSKTHGMMFDEAISSIATSDQFEPVRETFCKLLDPSLAYGFLLVHHQNVAIVNYTNHFGTPEYAVIFHMFTRDPTNMNNVDYKIQSDVVKQLPPPQDPFQLDPGDFGVIVKTITGEVYKVSSAAIIQKEQDNRGNYNPWINMLSVYMQCRPDYKVDN